jgi:hypothetical protein
MAEEERTGLSLFDGVLIVGGGLIAIFVALWLITAVTAVIWFVIKLAVVVALIAFVARHLFRRRS